MTSIARRWLGRSEELAESECPSYDTVKIQSVILSYVVGEGHRSEAVRDLLDWYFCEHKGDRGETVAAFLDLIAKGMISIHDGKVVPFRMDHVAQAAVVGYVVTEEHPGETIVGLAEKLSPGLNDGSVEVAIRDLVGAGLLEIEEGRVARVTIADERGGASR